MFDFFKRKKAEDKRNKLSSKDIFTEALLLIEKINEGDYKDWAKRDLAIFMGSSDNLVNAEKLISQIKDPLQKDIAYSGIALELIKKGNYDEALSINAEVKDKYNRSGVFHPMAQQQAKRGEYELCFNSIKATQKLIGSAAQTAAACAWIAFKNRDKAIAQSFLLDQNKNTSHIAAVEAAFLLDEGQESLAFEKLSLLNKNEAWRIFSTYAGAMQLWEVGIQAILKIKEASVRNYAWQKMAIAMGETGNKEEALNFLNKIKGQSHYAEGLRLLSHSMATHGFHETGLEIVNKIPSTYKNEQSLALAHIAKHLIEKGEIDKVNSILNRIPSPYLNPVLETFAERAIRLNEPEKARLFIDKIKDNTTPDMNLYKKSKGLAFLATLVYENYEK